MGTEALPEYTQCIKCKTHYKFYGLTPTWTYINGRGPYCEECLKRGVSVQTVLEETT